MSVIVETFRAAIRSGVGEAGGAVRMTVSLSVSWDDSKKKRGALALMVALLLVVPLPKASRAQVPSRSMATVIVESLPGDLDEARHAVSNLGGRVGRDLGIIGGFVAAIPA